jgi:hypothetical protein
MTLDQYLERYVEGYLFGDLHSMAAVKVRGPYGGVGYPMVMATLSGIELLGVLTSDVGFDKKKRDGDKRFRDYWQQYLYRNHPARQRIANAIYELVRHGLAHTYTAKPTFVVTKHGDGRHMSWSPTDDGESFWIDARIFADELIESYEQRVKPRLTADAAFKRQMELRYGELRDVYAEDFDDMKSQLKQAGSQPISGILTFEVNNISTKS